jgi:hypothetical protein
MLSTRKSYLSLAYLFTHDVLQQPQFMSNKIHINLAVKPVAMINYSTFIREK